MKVSIRRKYKAITSATNSNLFFMCALLYLHKLLTIIYYSVFIGQHKLVSHTICLNRRLKRQLHSLKPKQHCCCFKKQTTYSNNFF